MNMLFLIFGPLLILTGTVIIIHGALSMKNRPKAFPGRRVIKCGSCGKKLGIPPTGSRLKITCPSCKHSFHYIS